MATRITHMPKMVVNVTVGYFAENGTITASSPTLSQLSFTARKQGALIQLSNELIMDSNIVAEAMLREHAIQIMALDQDQQCLRGNGQSGAPTGVSNYPNVTVTSLAAATPVLTDLENGIN